MHTSESTSFLSHILGLFVESPRQNEIKIVPVLTRFLLYIVVEFVFST